MPAIDNITTTQEIEIGDIDSWLTSPGSDSITLPTPEKEVKKTVFSTADKVDFSYLDKEDDTSTIIVQKEELNEDGTVKTAEVTQKVDDLLNELDPKPEEEDITEEKTSKAGRPKTEKSGLIEFLKKRIEDQEMVTFDDFDEENGNLDEYLGSLSEADVEELWKANLDSIKTKIATDTPKEFIEQLPEQLQHAAKYVLDGGEDLKGLFRALAHVEEVRELNPEEESDQEHIVRGYLLATQYGDESEIDEEIEELKNLGTLEKKAKQFKPKLDSMKEQHITAQLADQEAQKAKKEAAAATYVNNTFEALRTGELNGIKLDKKVQAALYTGLIKPQYTSLSGRPTNLLGHLLEKYQVIEPNQGLIAEALWLLSNPEEYRENLVKSGKNAATEEITRKLKTEASRKTTTAGTLEEKPSAKGLRPQRQTNIFKR